jgi:hypothetical protein
LVDPGYENQLTSLDEILDSGIEFGYSKDINIFFNPPSVLRDTEVFERPETFSTCQGCTDGIRETGNFATFGPVWLVWKYTNIIDDHNSVCLLNDDDYAFVFTTTYVQKGSFFLESLNKFFALSIESGMVDKALRNSIYVLKPFRESTDVSDGYFVFALSHLSIVFYILFFGHGLSLLLFLCEVFYHFRLRYIWFCQN